MSFRPYYPKPQGKAESRFPPTDATRISCALSGSSLCCVSGVRAGELIEVPFPGGKTGTVRAIIEAAHVRSRAAAGDDLGNTVPLEMSKHREQHRMGIKSFARKYEIDLSDTAAELAERWRRMHPEDAE